MPMAMATAMAAAAAAAAAAQCQSQVVVVAAAAAGRGNQPHESPAPAIWLWQCKWKWNYCRPTTTRRGRVGVRCCSCSSSSAVPLPNDALGVPNHNHNHYHKNQKNQQNQNNQHQHQQKPKPPLVVSGHPPTFVAAPHRRIVALGDLHGDLSQATRALRLAGVLSQDGFHWTGTDTVLVQVGDILDRGPHEIAILSLLKSLHLQAQSHGGAVFQVNGNHETMNVQGDFRYVHPAAFDEFALFLHYLEQCQGNWDHAFLNWVYVSHMSKPQPKPSSPNNNTWPPWNLIKRQKGVVARSALLSPGGALACELSHHPVVLKINDWVFCHGGLLPHHVKYGVERMNKEVSAWMRGSIQETDGPEMPFIALRGYDSVVWNRLYSRDLNPLEKQPWQISSIAEKTLEIIKAKGMVVGHTPQINGANSKYDNRVWCIDVGMSSGVLNSSPEVLEIVGNTARVLKRPRDSSDGLEVLDYI